MKKRATKRRGLIGPVTRAMVETLEQRVLYDVTYVDFSGSGSVAEGQVVTYNISAGTDHDFIPGTVVHASVIIQQTGNDGSQNNTSYNVELQPGQSQNLYVFAKEEGSIVAEAECWDDPMYTYGFTNSEEAVYADPTVVTDAPLSAMNGLSSFFDYTDTSPGATAPRPVAEFFDANPNAQASDFSVQSIDWGDGTTDSSGYMQKDVDGVGWDVMAYHYYGGPNPATSLNGDGAWYPSATVTDEGGSVVTTQGKAAVAAKNWLNATFAQPPIIPVVPPAPPLVPWWPGGVLPVVPGWPNQPIPQPNNDVISYQPPFVVNGTFTRPIVFYVAEYTGVTNLGPPQTLISPLMLTVTENVDPTGFHKATILPGTAPAVVGWKAHTSKFGNVIGYEFVQVSITVTSAVSGYSLDLTIGDPFTGATCHVKCIFDPASTN